MKFHIMTTYFPRLVKKGAYRPRMIPQCVFMTWESDIEHWTLKRLPWNEKARKKAR